MAIAAFSVYKYVGAGCSNGFDTSKAPTFLCIDAVTSNHAIYPVAIPSGTDSSHSYENWLKIKCTQAPDNYCENFKIYGPTDPPGRGCFIYLGTASNRSTPTPTINQSNVATARSDIRFYDVGTAIDIPVSINGGKITAVGDKTDFVIFQLKLFSSAIPGAIGIQAYHLVYDES